MEDLLFEGCIDVDHKVLGPCLNRFRRMFAAMGRRHRVHELRRFTHWKWRLDKTYVKIDGEIGYRWRTLDHEDGVLESLIAQERDKAVALTFMKKAIKRHARPNANVAEALGSSGAALKEIGAEL